MDTTIGTRRKRPVLVRCAAGCEVPIAICCRKLTISGDQSGNVPLIVNVPSSAKLNDCEGTQQHQTVLSKPYCRLAAQVLLAVLVLRAF